MESKTIFAHSMVFSILLEKIKNRSKVCVSKTQDCIQFLDGTGLCIRTLARKDEIVFYKNNEFQYLVLSKEEIKKHLIKVKGQPYTFKDVASQMKFSNNFSDYVNK